MKSEKDSVVGNRLRNLFCLVGVFVFICILGFLIHVLQMLNTAGNLPTVFQLTAMQTAFVFSGTDTGEFVNIIDQGTDLSQYQATTNNISLKWECIIASATSQCQWLPLMKIVVVDNSPKTEKWTSFIDSDNWSAIGKTSDGVPISTNFKAEARVLPEDSALYLKTYGIEQNKDPNSFNFSARDLSNVMNVEMRQAVQADFARLVSGMTIEKVLSSFYDLFDTLETDLRVEMKIGGITALNLVDDGGIVYFKNDLPNN